MDTSSSDAVGQATKVAIARAKHRGRREVVRDDLLWGLLQTMARFGIVRLGSWAIDLEALDGASAEGAAADKPKVAYSSEVAALFDRAAAIAQKDGCANVELVHMLVAFAYEDDGLMGQLKRTYAFTGAEWRAALADWSPASEEERSANGLARSRRQDLQEKTLLSPDEAAEVLGVHTQTVRGYIRDGKLKAHRVAGERAIRIRREDLLALLEPYDPD